MKVCLNNLTFQRVKDAWWRFCGATGLRGVIAVAGHLAGGGGVLWSEGEKCGTLGAGSSILPFS